MESKKCVGKYVGLGPCSGDYKRFEFSVDCQDREPMFVSVKVSGSVMAETNQDPHYWKKLSAQAVREFVQGLLEKEQYEGNTITITSYWKPSTCIENYQEFEISLSTPSMGFILD